LREFGPTHVLEASPGPMAKSVSDCETIMNLWLKTAGPVSTHDHFAPKQCWNRDAYLNPTTAYGLAKDKQVRNGKLRIGYVTTDHFFEPAPPTKRALSMAIQKLRADGLSKTI
jgi:Asp-tRNA(Asn)/Glu-tRNA(Gln) amidotransferase A subunit family amidase